MIDRQADDVVPTWLMRYIGAVRTYAQRLQFFLGVPNTLMIAVLFYNDSTAVQSVFPTVYHWIAFILLVVVPTAIFADRVVLHPAQITYNAHQTARENRSPVYRELMNVKRELEELRSEQALADGGNGGRDDAS